MTSWAVCWWRCAWTSRRSASGLSDAADADLQARWERVDQALAQGLELKRRVIEDLRPTLLDNMGLFTALRWLATERSEQAQLKLQMEGLDEDIKLPPETAIAVFRTAQEAIANVVKHAGASRARREGHASAERLALEIADDGRGLPAGADRAIGSHGLKQMRFRMECGGRRAEDSPRAYPAARRSCCPCRSGNRPHDALVRAGADARPRFPAGARNPFPC